MAAAANAPPTSSKGKSPLGEREPERYGVVAPPPKKRPDPYEGRTELKPLDFNCQ